MISAVFDNSSENNEQIGQLRRNELVGILNTASPFNGSGYFQVKTTLKNIISVLFYSDKQ